MNKRKVVYIVSDIDKALAFEWLALGLKEKYELSFVLIGKLETRFSLFLKNCQIKFLEINDIKYPSRISKWFRVFLFLANERPNTVHTHLWTANLLGLSSAWLLGIKQRVYTRHHAIIHYNQFPSGRKWDILNNRLATEIVAISRNVEEILVTRDKAESSKVKLIHHGFDVEYFNSVTAERIETLKVKYNIPSSSVSPVIGVVSRYLNWKGIQYIIPAFQKILVKYPSSKLVLTNAHGDYQDTIKEMLETLPAHSFVEIKFEEDLAALYRIFDIFVHVPTDPQSEAFGQTYVEALICGIPSIFTLSGVAPEFIVDGENALVVPFCDSENIYQSILKILNEVGLRNHLIENGKKSTDFFKFSKMVEQLSGLYEND